MEGRSLLNHKELEEIPIFGTNRWDTAESLNGVDKARMSRSGQWIPYYLFGRISVIFCDKAFDYRLKANVIEESKIRGHTGSCNEDDFPSEKEIRRLISETLLQRDYDVSFMGK